MRFLFSFSLALLLGHAAFTSAAGTEQGDAAALCDFYNTVPAAGKAKLTNWCKNQNPCNANTPWFGVSCTNGRVDVIAINDLDGGRLPPSWGNMDEVIMIAMYANGLVGRIPSELGLLKKMDKLWLSDNKLTGPIPPSLCGYAKASDIDFYQNSGITCYPECLTARPAFMSHGRGGCRTVCPADGGASLPANPVDDCSNAPNKDTLVCPSGKRRACEGGKFVCHSGSTPGSNPGSTAPKLVTGKCPTNWKAQTGVSAMFGELRCSAPRGSKNCPSGWRKVSPATATKGVTCVKGRAPTRAPTPPPEAYGSYEETYAA